ncbi:MAG: MarR family winged helix-turn-helix transcriptional regulator [Gammaproteobacteria bacterium]|jgi:DNA-binding MarR family transcriptional regulator|nr:MarR family winged helix-turn-helix transcriptional regulator [Gammaproteobacteria bacterium]
MNRQDELNLALESMHFGFRAMIYQPDQRLAQLGLARIHHRLLYFIARHPGCSVNELLHTMRISKQYLNRPLKQMIELGYVEQATDVDDRRIRRLGLTASGKKLEFELSEVQRKRFAAIFERAGPVAEKHWREVMALLSEQIEF